jgi:tetratricopeptide (TPR) repeat protein
MESRLLNSLRLLGMTVLLLVGMSAPAYSQKLITVYGRVFLPDNQPATQIMVSISGESGFNSSAITDGRGGFRFDGIPRSVFSVTVTIPKDARFYAEPLTVDATKEGSNFMADIFLRNPLEAGVRKKRPAQVISTTEAGQQIPKDARKALDKARKYREERKFEAALAELNKAIVLYPAYFQAFAEKGIAQINLNRHEEALRNFEKAIELFPEYEPAVSGAGYCLLSLGRYEQSIAFLEKGVQLDSSRSQSLVFLGVANLALSRWQKAQEALEQALRLDAAGAFSAHIYLADAFAGQHQFSRAADELHTYLEKNPEAPNAERLRQREKYLRGQESKRN